MSKPAGQAIQSVIAQRGTENLCRRQKTFVGQASWPVAAKPPAWLQPASHWLSSITRKRMVAGLADNAALPFVTAYGRSKRQATAPIQALALHLMRTNWSASEAFNQIRGRRRPLC